MFVTAQSFVAQDNRKIPPYAEITGCLFVNPFAF